jgi:outer membrane immunogenic protein
MHRLIAASLAAASLSVGFGGTASAADLGPAPAPVYTKAPIAAPYYSWTGFYAGLNAGWVGERDKFSSTADPVSDASLGLPAGVTEGLAALSTVSGSGRSNGFIGGGQVGYNWQITNALVGIEADIQGLSRAGNSGSITSTAVVVGVPVTSTESASTSTSWLGTARGRLGWVATPTLLLYGTGGLAFGEVKASDALLQTGTNGFIGTSAASVSSTRAGWTAGAGVEWMFAPKWSLKGEYLHYDLGTVNFSSAAAATPASAQFPGQVFQTLKGSAHFEGDIARAGVNYHF